MLFRSEIYHMGSAGFGKTKKDSRLFQTFFFNTFDKKHTVSQPDNFYESMRDLFNIYLEKENDF